MHHLRTSLSRLKLGLCRFNPLIYSSSTRSISVQQLVYSKYGNPANVLRFEKRELDENAPLNSSQVFVKWKAAPVNPADINQIQGVYPVKPASFPAVAGNEGCAVVEKVGASAAAQFKPGDLVIPAQSGLGTWCSHGVYEAGQLFPVDSKLDVVAASMLQVNPSTAYRMLADFVPLAPGDLVAQNGANSAVGRYVIQMCRILGFATVNVVRDRPNIDVLKYELTELGADEVFTEEEFATHLRSKPPGARLALNCVGGRSSLQLARALGPAGRMVTYGGMSQQPVQVPTTGFIFQDWVLHGFWMSRWYEQAANLEERHRMYNAITGWYANGQLTVPPVEERKLEGFGQAFHRQEEEEEEGQRRRKKQLFVMDL